MRIDYHTHHVRCGHASGELEDYVLKGIEIGLTQLGLSDHMPLLHVDPAAYYPAWPCRWKNCRNILRKRSCCGRNIKTALTFV